MVYDVKQVSVADMPTYCCMYKFSILLHFDMFFSITMQTILSYSFILQLKQNEYIANNIINHNYCS